MDALSRNNAIVVAFLVLLSTLTISLDSWAEAPYTEGGTQPQLLPPFPLEHPGTCAQCHAGYDPDNHVEPWDTWAGSMMANAARDPIFWAALDVANADGEEMGFAGVGEFCLRCHTPKGWTEDRASADLSATPPDPPGLGDADGCLLGPSPFRIGDPDSDFSGLTCHFCHRMMVNQTPPAGELPFYMESGKYWIDEEVCESQIPFPFEPCRRGPYDYDAINDPTPPHPWIQSDYLLDNRICGNCHNVTNPLLNLVDANGDDAGVGGFPIERTFLEWEQSEFSDDQSPSFANCSSCHMPDATQDPAHASVQALYNRTGNMPIHQLVGGNTWIPQVLKGEYPSLNRDASFDATTAWAFDMLQNRSALVEVTTPSTVPVEGTLDAEVKITNLSGHKLPTGYGEGRRMWIHVVAKDGADATFWESGAWSQATGVLTDDPQLKVYEVQQGIWDENGMGTCDVVDLGGNHLFHFVRNNCVALDNRIPPLGFTGGDNPEIEPVNYTYPEATPGVLVNFDVTQYQIPVPQGTEGPVTVEATLYYQTASKEYVEFLRDKAVDGGYPDDCVGRHDPLPAGMSRGEYLYSLWNDSNGTNYGKSPPVDMDTAQGVTEIILFSDGFESGDTLAWSSTVP